ncbi:MAG: GNAT family N-acetyltransferase [Rhodospirillaceae bacterium]|jgi:ribosomal protein S18 acetylase RimI-like enzyme|nr:GNAT family N-acetyltransferase [Rhodospirillaceae bacterium]MBT5567026.1 GNAT family N-acetyltransferase [Rhodospirillaceae bacterium]MBT6089581.1 GNAT family N-acetyltransferase [Rhodospirillaceae bacterium]MBT6961365.1 GNAT family N-acetyltransferase [Rhodospirillaceae bacterium]
MLTIRSAEIEDAAHIANVHVKTWRATYAGIIPKAELNQVTSESRAITWARIIERSGEDTPILVSENEDGEIVGFVSGGSIRSVIPGHEAEISSLYILPGFQKGGHGRRLFMAESNRLSESGFEGLAVWVLKTNPATEFYKHLGGSLVSSRTIRYGSVDLDELAYGWADIPSYG